MSEQRIMPYTKKYIEQSFNKEVTNLFRDPAVSYSALPVKEKLTYDHFLSDKMLIIKAIRAGIPYSFFELIQSNSPFNDNDWAHFLDISTKSLQRYKLSARDFKPSQSEKILEVAELIHTGLDVFGGMPKFKLWLDTPNFALGSLKPVELVFDSYGRGLVINELTRINYGILV